MALEIDLGVHGATTPPAATNSTWKPPRHVYFGPRGPDGQMMDEPVYSHIEYPRLFYALSDDGKKIKATLVKSDEERDALGDKWVKMPGDLGYIGAPTLADTVRMAEEDAKEQLELAERNAAIALGEAIKRRPGRPPKEAA